MPMDLEHKLIFSRTDEAARFDGEVIVGRHDTSIAYEENGTFLVSVKAEASDIDGARHDIVVLDQAMLAAIDKARHDALQPPKPVTWGAAMTDSTQTPEYRENLAQIAEALMETTARNCPGWSPMDCPSEIVVDLVNERDELKAELAQIRIDYDRACALVAWIDEKPECRAAQFRNVLAELDRTKGDARCALKDLSRAYVNLLEVGRDRIISLGGECDSVEKMETGDPALIAAKAVLSTLT